MHPPHGHSAPTEGAPPCQEPDRNPLPPRFAPPAGATDTHAHVFGPAARYPFTADRSYTPPDCPVAEYMALLDTLGLARGVIVQPSVYGTDNRATLDALRAAPDRLRGVAVVDAGIPDAAMEEMHRLGVRGVRFNLLYRGGPARDAAERLAQRIAPLGWHMQFLIDISAVEGFAAWFAALPVPTVIDHMGHMDAARGADHPAFRDLIALLADGRSWVKLSGAYRISAADRPPFADVRPLARALVAARPDRMVWGTDWPHPAVTRPMPNDGDLLDLLADWVPDAPTRERILRDNPGRLYDFPRGGRVSAPEGIAGARRRAPAGACDTHFHIFGPRARYPYSPARGYTPPDAPLDDILALHEVLGVTRGVLTQPSVYGVDNRAILEAAALHPERLRAVVAVPGDIPDAELRRMDAAGARGIRINLADKGGMPFASLDEVGRFARRIEPLGWHVELLVHVHETDLEPFRQFPVDIVIGHFGYMPAALGPGAPGFRSMLSLVEKGRAWVKMTAPYRITDRVALPFGDVRPLAAALVAARPDRLLWGSDWPHPHIRSRATSPDDHGMFDEFARWLGDEATLRQVLVGNPARLYRF